MQGYTWEACHLMMRVEVYYGLVVNNQIRHGETAEMSVVSRRIPSFYYSVNLSIAEGGEYGSTFRVIPKHKELFNKHDIRLSNGQIHDHNEKLQGQTFLPCPWIFLMPIPVFLT